MCKWKYYNFIDKHGQNVNVETMEQNSNNITVVVMHWRSR